MSFFTSTPKIQTVDRYSGYKMFAAKKGIVSEDNKANDPDVNETEEIDNVKLDDSEKKCYLGKCASTSLKNIIKNDYFKDEDVETEIVYLRSADKKYWYCWDREGFRYYMRDPESTRVEWLPTNRIDRLTQKERDQGQGFVVDTRSSRKLYQQITIHDQQVFILMDDKTVKLIDNMRQKLPAFQMVSLGKLRLGNTQGERSVSGTHGQAEKDQPIHPTYALSFIALKNMRIQCNERRAPRGANQYTEVLKKEQSLENKRLLANERDDEWQQNHKRINDHQHKIRNIKTEHKEVFKKLQESFEEMDILHEYVHRQLQQGTVRKEVIESAKNIKTKITEYYNWEINNIKYWTENAEDQIMKNEQLKRNLDVRLKLFESIHYLIENYNTYSKNLLAWQGFWGKLDNLTGRILNEFKRLDSRDPDAEVELTKIRESAKVGFKLMTSEKFEILQHYATFEQMWEVVKRLNAMKIISQTQSI